MQYLPIFESWYDLTLAMYPGTIKLLLSASVSLSRSQSTQSTPPSNLALRLKYDVNYLRSGVRALMLLARGNARSGDARLCEEILAGMLWHSNASSGLRGAQDQLGIPGWLETEGGIGSIAQSSSVSTGNAAAVKDILQWRSQHTGLDEAGEAMFSQPSFENTLQSLHQSSQQEQRLQQQQRLPFSRPALAPPKSTASPSRRPYLNIDVTPTRGLDLSADHRSLTRTPARVEASTQYQPNWMQSPSASAANLIAAGTSMMSPSSSTFPYYSYPATPTSIISPVSSSRPSTSPGVSTPISSSPIADRLGSKGTPTTRKGALSFEDYAALYLQASQSPVELGFGTPWTYSPSGQQQHTLAPSPLISTNQTDMHLFASSNRGYNTSLSTIQALPAAQPVAEPVPRYSQYNPASFMEGSFDGLTFPAFSTFSNERFRVLEDQFDLEQYLNL